MLVGLLALASVAVLPNWDQASLDFENILEGPKRLFLAGGGSGGEITEEEISKTVEELALETEEESEEATEWGMSEEPETVQEEVEKEEVEGEQTEKQEEEVAGEVEVTTFQISPKQRAKISMNCRSKEIIRNIQVLAKKTTVMSEEGGTTEEKLEVKTKMSEVQRKIQVLNNQIEEFEGEEDEISEIKAELEFLTVEFEVLSNAFSELET